MQPSIKSIQQKRLIGMSTEMSLIENKTFQLFSTFMPNKKTIKNAIGTDVYDVRIYPTNYHRNFSPATPFTKWALVEVSNFESIPEGMKNFTLESGDYAVFTQTNSDIQSFFTYIFTEWLPKSDYSLDDRPHFDVLDEVQQRREEGATQEFWIPVRRK